MWTEALERADAAHLGLPGSTSKFDRPFLGSESVAKGTYGSVPTAAVSAIAAIAADPNPKTENRKRKPKTNTGAGETLTAGSFVPTERSSGGESAVEALERLAAASNSRKAAAMRAAEFARATVGGGADGNAGELSGELSPTANATGGASGSGDAAAVAALALATLVVPLCGGGRGGPRLMPAVKPTSHTSRRFRGAARSGTGGARGSCRSAPSCWARRRAPARRSGWGGWRTRFGGVFRGPKPVHPRGPRRRGGRARAPAPGGARARAR